MSLSNSILVGDRRSHTSELEQFNQDLIPVNAHTSQASLEWFEEEDLVEEWVPETFRSRSSSTTDPNKILIDFNHQQVNQSNISSHSASPTKHSKHLTLSRSNSQLEISNSGLFESSKAPSLPSISSTKTAPSLFSTCQHFETIQNSTVNYNPINAQDQDSNAPSATGTVNIITSALTSPAPTDTVIKKEGLLSIETPSSPIHSNPEISNGTTQFHKDASQTVQERIPAAQNGKIETPQWKRALNRAQNPVDYGFDTSKHRSFGKMFNPPTIDIRNLANEENIYGDFSAQEYQTQQPDLQSQQKIETQPDCINEHSNEVKAQNDNLLQEHYHANSNTQNGHYVQANSYPRQYSTTLGDFKQFLSPESQHTTGSNTTTTTGMTGTSSNSITTRTSAATTTNKSNINYSTPLVSNNNPQINSTVAENPNSSLTQMVTLRLFGEYDTYTNNRLDNILYSMAGEEESDHNEHVEQQVTGGTTSSSNNVQESHLNHLANNEVQQSINVEGRIPRELNDSQADYDSQHDYSGSYVPDDEELYESTEEIEYQNNDTQSDNTNEQWNSDDRRHVTTQDFMANAEHVMDRLRGFFPPSTLSINELVNRPGNDEFEAGEYTTVEDSSIASDHEQAHEQNPHLRSTNTAISYASEIDTTSIAQFVSPNPQDSNSDSNFQTPSPYYSSIIVRSQIPQDEHRQLVSTIKPSGDHSQAFQQNVGIYENIATPQRPPFSSRPSLADQSSSISQSILHSPEKTGRRNMHVILRTDEMVKNIPQTMGSMQYDSKKMVWYKVDESDRHISQDPKSRAHQDRSTKPYHPEDHSNSMNARNTNNSLRESSRVRDIPIDVPRNGKAIPSGNATPTSPVFNTFTSADIDVFSGIEDLESSSGANNRSRLGSNDNQGFSGSKYSGGTVESNMYYSSDMESNNLHGGSERRNKVRSISKSIGNDRLHEPISVLPHYSRDHQNMHVTGSPRKTSRSLAYLQAHPSSFQSKIPISSRRPLPTLPMLYSTPQPKISRASKPNPEHLLPATPKAQSSREQPCPAFSRYVSNPFKSNGLQPTSRSVSRSPRKNQSGLRSHEFTNISELSRISEINSNISVYEDDNDDTFSYPAVPSNIFSLDVGVLPDSNNNEQAASMLHNGKLASIFDKTMLGSIETPSRPAQGVLAQITPESNIMSSRYETPSKHRQDPGDKENSGGGREQFSGETFSTVDTNFSKSFNETISPDASLAKSKPNNRNNLNAKGHVDPLISGERFDSGGKRKQEVSFDVTPRVMGDQYRYKFESSSEVDTSISIDGDYENTSEHDYEGQGKRKNSMLASAKSSGSSGLVHGSSKPVSTSVPNHNSTLERFAEHGESAITPNNTSLSFFSYNEDQSINATQISLIDDISYQHNRASLVQVLTDRYSGDSAPTSPRGSSDGFSDDGNSEHTRNYSASLNISMHMSKNIERGVFIDNGVIDWTTLTDINLSQANLESLVKLDIICPRLVRLDVSHNKLNIIVGIPTSVQTLDLSHNKLTNMTIVGGLNKLTNLQDLNISNNKALTNLGGVSHLVNLRELRARDCGIDSLSTVYTGRLSDFLPSLSDTLSDVSHDDGGDRDNGPVPTKHKTRGLGFAKNLDSLSILDLRNNKLAGVFDFKNGCEFSSGSRLESVNLSGNKICDVWNVSLFSRLKSLILGMLATILETTLITTMVIVYFDNYRDYLCSTFWLPFLELFTN